MAVSSSAKTKHQNRIRLFTFPPVPHVYSMCPFALKLESFLRINDLDYDVVYTSAFSSKGTIPYIRLIPLGDEWENSVGEEVADSNIVIDRLLSDFPCPSQDELTALEKGTTHAIIRMLEEHTAQIGFHFRYGLYMSEFCEAAEIRDRIFCADESRLGAFVYYFFKRFQPKGTLKKSKYRNLTRHTADELWSMSNDDIQALEDLLSHGNEVGSQKYFFGRSQPSLVDCAIFGHLSQFLYIPMDFPQKAYLKEKCPFLLQFMENFRLDYWPDWDVKCTKKPNDMMVNDNNPEKKKRIAALKRKMITRLSAVIIAGVAVYFGIQQSN